VVGEDWEEVRVPEEKEGEGWVGMGAQELAAQGREGEEGEQGLEELGVGGQEVREEKEVEVSKQEHPVRCYHTTHHLSSPPSG